ncbi:MAG TPA: hypothetical protein GXX40_06730 [Firmicutes bacterium]|nr:hypothetical protein [Bacillota bacterium]
MAYLWDRTRSLPGICKRHGDARKATGDVEVAAFVRKPVWNQIGEAVDVLKDLCHNW